MKAEAVLFDRLGTQRLAPLPTAATFKPKRNLTGPDEMTLQLPVTAPEAGLIYEGMTEIGVYLGGNPDPWFYGTIWDMRSGSGSEWLTYTCEGLEALFGDRRIEADLSYTNMDQANIAWNLIQHTQSQPGGSFGIVSGHTLTGKLRDRPYHRDERQLISERLHSFRTIIDGMDWDIVVLADGRREFQTWYPQRGTRKMNHVIEWGKNILDYDLSVNGRMVNDVIQIGQGEGPDRLEGRYTDTAARDTRGLRTHVLAVDEDLVYVETMEAKARKYVEDNVNPNKFLDVTIRLDDPTALDVGDEVPIRIQRGAIDMTGIYRIVGLELTPHENRAKLDIDWVDDWEVA